MHPKGYYQRYKAPRVHVQNWIDAHGPIPKGYVVDHRDGDIHNNHISNLRLATVAQNISNCKIPTDNKTGVKGLTWDPARGKYRGSIVSNKKQASIRGDMLTVVAWLYRMRPLIHGEFARFI